jgi:putative membrane protein
MDQSGKPEIDVNTRLAADRTVLAAERTYAAWVRSGLAALASGVGTKTLLNELVPEWLIISTATLLVLFSGFCFAAAVWRELAPGLPPPKPHVKRLPRTLLLLVNGFLVLVTLVALVGIWTGRTGHP